jgi:hypothetical protein
MPMEAGAGAIRVTPDAAPGGAGGSTLFGVAETGRMDEGNESTASRLILRAAGVPAVAIESARNVAPDGIMPALPFPSDTPQ